MVILSCFLLKLKFYICDLMFEQEGLFEYIVFGELQNDFVVLDDDLMSMEYPQFFSNYFLVWRFHFASSL